MRYIKGLTKDTIKLLKRINKESKYHQVRQRSHCILLSYQKHLISELIAIFQVSRNTIYNWLNNWDTWGLVGLYDRPGRGRKKLFDELEQKTIKEWVKQTPKNLGRVQERIKQEWDIVTSKDTIKRVIKCLGMKWKRMGKRVGGEPEKEVYERKKKILKALKKLDEQGSLDLRYLDESAAILILKKEEDKIIFYHS